MYNWSSLCHLSMLTYFLYNHQVDKLLQDTLKLDGDVAIDKGLKRNEVFHGWGKQYLVEFTIEVNR